MEHFLSFAEQNMLMIGAWLVIAALLVYSFIAPALAKYKRVNNHEATMLINKKDAVILDIRAQKEFRTGHIQGSRQVKPEQMRAGDFSSLEKLKNKPIVVVCAMGNQASSTAANLTKHGFEEVYVLDGGINGWTSAGLPVSK